MVSSSISSLASLRSLLRFELDVNWLEISDLRLLAVVNGTQLDGCSWHVSLWERSRISSLSWAISVMCPAMACSYSNLAAPTILAASFWMKCDMLLAWLA